MMKTIDHYDRLMLLFGKDREKRPDVENSKGTAKKKARTEPPKERLHRTPLNGKESAVAESSDKKVDKIEVSILVFMNYYLFSLVEQGKCFGNLDPGCLVLPPLNFGVLCFLWQMFT
jgi:hypothetical protein